MRIVKMRKAGLASGLRGDEVYTPSPRRSEGWRDQLGGRCSSRATSKTSMPTLNEQRNLHPYICIDAAIAQVVQKKFSKFFLCVQPTPSRQPKVRKNKRFSCPKLSHPSQRCTTTRMKRLAQRFFLARARNQYPNLPRCCDGTIAESDPIQRRFGRIFYRAINRFVGNRGFQLSRKERSHMAVFAHAEKN